MIWDEQKKSPKAHENEYIKPRKTFCRNSKQFLKILSKRLLSLQLNIPRFYTVKANTTTDEIEKTRREKLAGHCFALSQVTYTALVLGSLLVYFQDMNVSLQVVFMLISGVCMALAFSLAGNNLLKSKTKK